MADKEEEASRFEGDQEHGWAPDSGGASDSVKEANQKAWEGEGGEPGSGRDVSDEERGGVGPTDTEAQTPLGVGGSTARRGEDIAQTEGDEGAKDLGTKGESDRPYGTSSPDRTTGVDPQGSVTEGSPDLPPGDQGG